MRSVSCVLTVAPAESSMLFLWLMTYPLALSGQLVRIKCETVTFKETWCRGSTSQSRYGTRGNSDSCVSYFVSPGAGAPCILMKCIHVTRGHYCALFLIITVFSRHDILDPKQFWGEIRVDNCLSTDSFLDLVTFFVAMDMIGLPSWSFLQCGAGI